jgi:hypothetical protein
MAGKFSENIGPVEAVFDDISLGYIKDGAQFTFNESSATTTADITGETPREEIIIGVDCSVSFAITEATLEQLAEITGGTVESGSTKDALALKARVGQNLVDLAATLILKPIIAGVATTDESKWIVIPKAAPRPEFQVNHSITDQRLWNVAFKGYPLTADDVASGGGWDGLGYQANQVAKLGNAD